MLWTHPILLASLLLAPHATADPPPDPLVILSDSRITYRGTTHDDVDHFQRIRYAQDPRGANRFAPPKPYSPRKRAVVSAQDPDVACPQQVARVPLFNADVAAYSEDCLSLRIARPRGTTVASKLPVLVFLHGGGFVTGSAALAAYEPTKLVRQAALMNESMVYVGVNYRLGVFGFAASEELRRGRSLNVGLRDQKLALEWVRRHIADFGGDAARVALAGQSAGATLTMLHQLGEEEVPFQRIWQMSGTTGNLFNSTGEEVVEHTRAVAERVGCVKKEVVNLKCLRKVETGTLLDAALGHIQAVRPPDGLLTFTPMVDGVVIPDRPSRLLHAGKMAQGLDIVTSWTQDDGSILAIGPESITADNAIVALRKWLGSLTDVQLATLMALYPTEEFADRAAAWGVSPSAYQVYQIVRDVGFTCPAIDYAYHMQRHAGAQVRLLALNQTALNPTLDAAGLGHLGVIHSADLNYMFLNPPQGQNFTKTDQQLARDYATALVRFVGTGSPAATSTSKDWPMAFSEGLGGDAPDHFSLQVLGGPLGHGSATLLRNESLSRTAAAREAYEASLEPQDMGYAAQMGQLFGSVQQQVLSFIGRSKAKRRLDQLHKERFFERCEHVRGLADTLVV